MEPVLKFIDSVGERLEKLRTRLQTLKLDILQRSIAIQTEATRDNTHRLERIQREIKDMAEETHGLNVGVLQLVQQTQQVHKEAAEIGKMIKQLQHLRAAGGLLYAAAGWIVGAAIGPAGAAAALWTFLSKTTH